MDKWGVLLLLLAVQVVSWVQEDGYQRIPYVRL